MHKECEVYTSKMGKTIDVLKSDFATVRAGRANPGVLDKLTVEHYGSAMPINQLASISVPEPRMLAIQPWDKSALKAIEKAIMASDLGINPQNDGSVIRLIFPQLTEERRKDLTKQVKKMGEDAKVAIRNIRRDANDKVKADKKNSVMTEDEAKISDKNIQDLTDKYIKEIDNVTAAKTKEIMEI